MEPDRTDLTWSYDPKDFFEARYEGVYHDWKLAIEDGRIAASVLGGPPSEASEAAISSFVRSVFQTRAMQTRRPFRLDQRANLIEYRGDTQNQTIRIGIADCVVVRDQLDFQIVDAASGTVIRDSKAERIAEETAEINGLSAKAQRHPVLQGMLASYSMAIGDPANELTHLYEIRDALAKYFRSDTTAKRSLQIVSSPVKRTVQ